MSQSSIGQALYDSGLRGCIQSAIKDDDKNLLGVVVVHDKTSEELSQPFSEELRFLTLEIQRILLYFFEHHGQIENIQLLLGHDINSNIIRIHNQALKLYLYS